MFHNNSNFKINTVSTMMENKLEETTPEPVKNAKSKIEITKRLITNLKEILYTSSPSLIGSFLQFENKCIEFWNKN